MGGARRKMSLTSAAVRVVTLTSARAQRELSASPLKPNEERNWRSEKSEILEVWYLRVRACAATVIASVLSATV